MNKQIFKETLMNEIKNYGKKKKNEQIFKEIFLSYSIRFNKKIVLC